MRKSLILVALMVVVLSVNGIANAQTKAPTSNVTVTETVTTSQPGQIKEVYVNLDALWRVSEKGKKDIAEIDKKFTETKGQMAPLEQELNTLATKIKDAKTDAERKPLEQQFIEKRRQLLELTTARNKEIEELRATAQQSFIQDVLPLINKYRQDNGYHVIHRYTPNDVISIDPRVDITEEILSIYNQNKPQR